MRSELPPTWEQIRWRGSGGEQAPRLGWPRTLANAWAHVVMLPARVLVLWVDWILRCPSRTAAAVALYALLAHLRWLSWLPWPGFLP